MCCQHYTNPFGRLPMHTRKEIKKVLQIQHALPTLYKPCPPPPAPPAHTVFESSQRQTIRHHLCHLTVLAMEIPGASSRCSMAMSSTSLLKRSCGIAQSRKGCRYDPERAGVGIVSAIMEPTNARLHIVGPLIHTNAREILQVTLPNLIWSNRRPFRAAILSCGLCRNWIGSGTVYMYKGEMGFCKPECVNDYIVEQLEKQTRRLRWCQREKVPPMEDDKEGNQSSMFFTCAGKL
ncbi:uncharacterized protein LOC119289778 [Triticum dicoccoides]|nr:uncharacterized protein LOC119289778 [Triticum dicoccoides]XP_044361261.1 uncharacterized protein LOC123083241 isoform X1 [Triticum aestivum]XP_044361262.1 uncharacterized protein LOC123083241 isoform X1 [Triticum aestivum]